MVLWLFSCSSRSTNPTPNTTTYSCLKTTSASMDFHIIHAYLCGHFDSTTLPGATSPQYVFVDAGCSDYLCSHTDTEWFKTQGTSAGPKDVGMLTSYSRQLTNLQSAVAQNAVAFTAVSDNAQCAAEMGYPELLGLVSAADAQEHMQDLLHIKAIKSLLKYARQFGKSGKTRPFLDFCKGELSYFLDQASVAHDDLLKAVELSDLLSGNVFLAKDLTHWPAAGDNHEPGFGQAELKTLRAAGQAGEEIMTLPFGKGTLHVANLLIRTLDQNVATPTAPTTTSPPCSLPVAAPPSSSLAETDFEMWLIAQEVEFMVELKAAMANKAKKTARHDRIKKLKLVGKAMDRVSKSFSPGVARFA